jgi:hypothetical protein
MSMSPGNLIAEIAALGASLSRRGHGIVLSGASMVPPELKEVIRSIKPELVTHLAESAPDPAPAEINRWN